MRSPSQAVRFQLEPLEVRVLLSASGFVAPATSPGSSTSSAAVIEVVSESSTPSTPTRTAASEAPSEVLHSLFDGLAMESLGEADQASGTEIGLALAVPVSDSGNPLAVLSDAHAVQLTPDKPIDARSLDGSSESQLSGTGIVQGDLKTLGTLSPGNSPGIIRIEGNLTTSLTGVEDVTDGFSGSAGGTLALEIAGKGEAGAADGFDQVQVTGDVNLGGAVRISLLNGFVPQVGDRFDVLTFGGHLTGSFASASGLFGFGSGNLFWDLAVTDSTASALGKVTLVATALPNGLTINLPDSTSRDAFGQVLASYFPVDTATFDNLGMTVAGLGTLSGSLSVRTEAHRLVLATSTGSLAGASGTLSAVVSNAAVAAIFNDDGSRVLFASGHFALDGASSALLSGAGTFVSNTGTSAFAGESVQVESTTVAVPAISAGVARWSGTMDLQLTAGGEGIELQGAFGME